MWRPTLILVLAACSASGDRPTETPNAPSPSPSTTAPQPTPPQPTAPQPTPPQPTPPPPPEEQSHLPGHMPAPEGFVDVGFGVSGPKGKAGCHGLSIEHINDDPNAFEPRVKVTDQTGRVVYAARGRAYRIGDPPEAELHMSLVVDRCGDLTGDAVPELMMTERTIGAHCCYTHYVVSMTQPPKQLLMWEKGDAGHGMVPVKWKDGKSWQILSMHLVLPPFDANAGDPVVGGYAGIPSYPIVFELVGGSYQKRTFQFGKALARMREEDRQRCKKSKDGCGDNELYDWGMALIIGDWDQEKKAITDNDFRAALEKRATAMRSRLRDELGR